jgi:hypothetical protein
VEMDLVKKIEARISELETQYKKMVDFVNGATANIKKLVAERTKATDESNALSGAIQAFKSVIGEISENEKKSAEELKLKEDSEKKESAGKKEKNV